MCTTPKTALRSRTCYRDFEVFLGGEEGGGEGGRGEGGGGGRRRGGEGGGGEGGGGEEERGGRGRGEGWVEQGCFNATSIFYHI